MTLAERLAAHASREQALISRLSGRFADDLGDVLSALTRRVRALLRELETTKGRLVASRAALGRALALRRDLQAALAQAGYSELAVRAVDAPLDRLAATVLQGRSIVAEAARLTPLDVDALAAFKELRLADLLEVGDTLTNTLWRTTVEGVLGLRSIDALVDELAAQMEVSARQARTIHDTAVSTYSRQVDQLGIVPKPSDRFLYVGPEDSAMRPFCRTWIGKIVTRRELDGISNGQLPNTLLTAGGYNCRHKWQPVFGLTLEALEAAA